MTQDHIIYLIELLLDAMEVVKGDNDKLIIQEKIMNLISLLDNI